MSRTKRTPIEDRRQWKRWNPSKHGYHREGEKLRRESRERDDEEEIEEGLNGDRTES